MFLTIDYIKEEIVNRGGILRNNPDKVSKSYNNSKQNFDECKTLVKNIMSKVNPKHDSNYWLDDKDKNRKHFNFDYFSTKKEEIYYRKGDTINIIDTSTKDNDYRNYVEKSIYFSKSIYHEILVSFIINTLPKNLLRHFIYTYDYDIIEITRSRPYKKDSDEETLKKINIYMDTVPNSKSFGEYIEEKGSSDFIDVYYNVCIVIKEAYREIGFTHFDLHTSNVLIEKLEEPEEFVYSDGTKIKTRRLIRIIDYGYSSAIFNGKNYRFKNNKIKFMGEVDNPITDCFKLLIHAYKRMKRKNAKYGDEHYSLEPFNVIFAFFCEGITIDDMIEFNEGNNHYNNIPKYYSESGIDKIEEFIDYLNEKFY